MTPHTAIFFIISSVLASGVYGKVCPPGTSVGPLTARLDKWPTSVQTFYFRDGDTIQVKAGRVNSYFYINSDHNSWKNILVDGKPHMSYTFSIDDMASSPVVVDSVKRKIIIRFEWGHGSRIGQYTNVTAECIPCSSGTYTMDPDQDECIECDPGTYKPFGAPPTTECMPCPSGTFNNKFKAIGCDECQPLSDTRGRVGEEWCTDTCDVFYVYARLTGVDYESAYYRTDTWSSAECSHLCCSDRCAAAVFDAYHMTCVLLSRPADVYQADAPESLVYMVKHKDHTIIAAES